MPHIRTGSHNQGDIQARFEVMVTPSPTSWSSMSRRRSEPCWSARGRTTAARQETRRCALNDFAASRSVWAGLPLLAVLGGIGWARVNDTLGPVIRDTDGRVFTLANLPEMLTVAPFPTLVGLAPQVDVETVDAGEQQNTESSHHRTVPRFAAHQPPQLGPHQFGQSIRHADSLTSSRARD